MEKKRTTHEYGLTHIVFREDPPPEMRDALEPVYEKNGYSVTRICMDW
ncbi:MAG: hypothetical protein KKD56_04725 [Acidobacteria bacterium]|nr:hypothetical protein [Acidobacteriota bacterium]MCG2814414.1 hypothetical protein [Candidatus Aminicenantes bacterium]MBU1338355.1 hypothetical protein [Acidobacteriota bacterium]MBU1473511.1 hypothetical protein [Acidobacteriota bacterium]MBU4203453.1 hypothetical protein [Acidobacteriota bacterium]